MGGPSSLDAFAPLANPLADRIAAIAARIGSDTADCAVRLYPLPMAEAVRQTFEAETLAAIADLLDDFGQLTPADRERFQSIAHHALAVRLQHHAAAEGVAL